MVEEAEVSKWIKEKAGPKASLYLDSRRIQPGDVFFAVCGTHTDGRKFVAKAAELGASCAVVESAAHFKAEILFTEVCNLYKKCGAIASDYYGNPSQAMYGCAVTGTNGKTTAANWISELFTKLGKPSGCIGTLGCTCQGEPLPSVAMTTPDPLTVQKLFAELRDRGCEAFAIEASSIGLEQGRLRGAAFKVGIFTNLTRDHLDYHGDMEHYAEAKEILFSWPGLEYAVINFGDPASERMAQAALRAGVKVFSVGISQEAKYDLTACNVRHAREGLSFDLVFEGRVKHVTTRLLGTFNIENFLCAAAPCILSGFDFELVCETAQNLNPPAGRMQTVTADDGLLAAVDYSHTPDAILKALAALRELAEVRGGRLKIVVGAGGDRDSGKRPLMGRAACEADEMIFTSDNPRSEDPMLILREVCAGAVKPYRMIEDRAEAIREAVRSSSSDDVILIAGKGHEDYQEIQGVKHHFSDAEQVRNAMMEFRKKHE